MRLIMVVILLYVPDFCRYLTLEPQFVHLLIKKFLWNTEMIKHDKGKETEDSRKSILER